MSSRPHKSVISPYEASQEQVGQPKVDGIMQQHARIQATGAVRDGSVVRSFMDSVQQCGKEPIEAF